MRRYQARKTFVDDDGHAARNYGSEGWGGEMPVGAYSQVDAFFGDAQEHHVAHERISPLLGLSP